MTKFDNTVKILEERFKPIRTSFRKFYPRKLKLSEDFTSALKKEYSRLQHEGHDPRRLAKMLEKALPFHLRD
tara:strand:+ start:1464 stop:1679 length:216 start_codon:yes stop_codon:yes gene_type:complete